jgi:hypothetical protein
MIEFERTIGASEVNYTYLNLSDDRGRSFGPDFDLEHRARVAIRDSLGRITTAQKHHANQLWGTLYNWFTDNDVQPGARVRVRFDPGERHNGLPVIHLLREADVGVPPPSSPAPEAAVVAPAYASEIPVRLERQLEDFLAANPGLIEPGLLLFRDEDGRPGQQYPTDVGVIDLLCRRPSGELLVIELKRSRISDVVVGQVSRYIGWVKKHLAEGAQVSGLILCHERDEGLKYAVFAYPNLGLKYFKIRLELVAEEEL